MQGEKIYKEFIATAKYWLKELEYYGEGQFKQKTPESEWTIGQLYDHLIAGTYNFHLKEISKCLGKVGGQAGGEKKFKGKVLFMIKAFPPMKILGNGDVPAQPENIPKVQDNFFKFFKVMHKAAKQIDASPDLSYKTAHPSLGMLNALEWYKLILFHYRHHLKQKARMDKHIRSIYKVTNAEADIEV